MSLIRQAPGVLGMIAGIHSIGITVAIGMSNGPQCITMHMEVGNTAPPLSRSPLMLHDLHLCTAVSADDGELPVCIPKIPAAAANHCLHLLRINMSLWHIPSPCSSATTIPDLNGKTVN